MRTISKLLAVSAMFLAVPALAQTIDGGQGEGCNVDTDCGDICGWVCDFNLTPHTCVPAVFNTNNPGSEGIGWCEGSTGCACPGQTCQGVNCAPATFSNGSPQCICDTDCPSGQHCDQSLQMCQPASETAKGCNYDGECGCGCFCIKGACECTGAIPPSCSTDDDCDPQGCLGLSCNGGTCVHDEADCLNQNVTTDGGSSSSSSSGSVSSSSSGGPSSATLGGSSSSGSSSTPASSSSSGSASASGSSSSSGSATATSGACFQVGTPCAQNTDCCNQYCDSSVCKCNKAETPGKYPCVTQSDCCSGTCTGGLCVGGATDGGSGSSSSGGASTTVASSSSSSSGGATTTSASKSGGCSTGAGGAEGLALLALGLSVLIRRKRLA